MFKIFITAYMLAGGPAIGHFSSTHEYESKAACEIARTAGPDEPTSPSSLVVFFKEQKGMEVRLVSACAPADQPSPLTDE